MHRRAARRRRPHSGSSRDAATLHAAKRAGCVALVMRADSPARRAPPRHSSVAHTFAAPKTPDGRRAGRAYRAWSSEERQASGRGVRDIQARAARQCEDRAAVRPMRAEACVVAWSQGSTLSVSSRRMYGCVCRCGECRRRGVSGGGPVWGKSARWCASGTLCKGSVCHMVSMDERCDELLY